jgi:hypothetical protein
VLGCDYSSLGKPYEINEDNVKSMLHHIYIYIYIYYHIIIFWFIPKIELDYFLIVIE